MPDDSSVRVLERACQVLDCFTAAQPRLRIADLRRLTGLPPTTVARIVKTLVAEELLERNGDEYRLGLRVLVWTAPATAGSDLIAVSGPVVEQVRDYTGETTGVYVRQGANRVAVSVALSNFSVIYRGHVGQVRPLHAGAAGKVFMAFDEAALDAALRRGLARFTDRTITNPDRLRDELAAVRELRWAFAAEENEAGLNSLAAPILGANGLIVATLAVGAPSFRLSREAAEGMVPMVCAAALSISQRLGYTGHLTTAAERAAAAAPKEAGR
ncbi:IclR family transcriptional regulator [Microbispora sp. NPDC046933]|uniref:IclR family transcriptional regulator n=1 Tax=Microbispora sp. NPDC046933 TaxID=3155618 RepID=UPI0033D6BDF5